MSQCRQPALGADRQDQPLEAGHIVYPHKGLSDLTRYFLMAGEQTTLFFDDF
jgi:hypothetical protein